MSDQGDKALPTEIIVRQFRQVLVWPLQLTPKEGSITATAYWERLLELDSAWQEVADEFTEDLSDFQERHYAEFVAFMPDVQHFLYGEGRTQHSPNTNGDSPIRVFRRRDVAKAHVALHAGAPVIALDVARVELYFFYDIDMAVLAVEVACNDLSLEQVEDMLFRFGRAYPTSWESSGGGAHCCAGVSLLAQDGTVLAKSDYEQKERYLAFVCEHRAPRLADHWDFLLKPLMPHHGSEGGPILYRQLEHHRIPLLAYLAVDDPYRIAREDWLRLGLAARPGRPGIPPFAAGFLEDFEARHCYDRFWDGERRHARSK